MSTLRVDTIQNAAGTDSPISVPGTAKAWVNFNGTGTVAIRASYNVSSITDNGVGDYTVNFTTALADANFSGVISASYNNGTGNLSLIASPRNTSSGNPFTATTAAFGVMDRNAAASDGGVITVAIFR
jgi:hypothetical protein